MAKHLLFFVHGMGKHDDKWHEPGLKVLKSAFDEYPLIKKNLKFDDLFEPVPVVYDNQFEKLRQRWAADLAGFKSALLGGLDSDDDSQKNVISGKVDDISQWAAAGGDSFFTTHALDVILYRFFKTVRMNINVQVATQIVTRLKGDAGPIPQWSVLCHSLGTSVGHNTLNAMYGAGVDGTPRLRVEDTRPRVVAMVANVSRVLQLPSVPVYKSRVQPGSALSDRCCMYYLNARHRLDPFTVPKPFFPDAWPDPVIFNSEQYAHLQPSHFLIDKPEGVHDFDHYLKNPRVHAPLFRALVGRDFIPDDDFQKAKERFDAQSIHDGTDAIREKLEKLMPAPTADWRALIAILKKLRS